MTSPLPKPCSVKQGYKENLDCMSENSVMLMAHWAEQETVPLLDPSPPWQSERPEGFYIHTGEMAPRNEPRVL